MYTDLPTDRDITRAMHDGLAEAAGAAGYAPSIDNTQPWQWRLRGNQLDLYLERSRVLSVTDPYTRLAALSCGAALHHACTVLAAEGWRAVVDRLPNPADQDHLARIRVAGPAPANPRAVRHVRTIPTRHTNRRPVTGAPVGSEDLRAVNEAVRAEGGSLYILKPDQVLDLAAAADHAQRTETDGAPWQAELAYWTGGVAGGQPISSQRDRAALFAILHGQSDETRDWLRAGEALSAGWLTATERGVSVMPMSAPVEVTATRDTMRRLLSYLSHPYLVLRLGTGDAVPDETPRLPTDQIIQLSTVEGRGW